MQLPPSSDSISLQGLAFGTRYEVEVIAVNANGSSVPGTFNFTIGEEPSMQPYIPFCSDIYGSWQC